MWVRYEHLKEQRWRMKSLKNCPRKSISSVTAFLRNHQAFSSPAGRTTLDQAIACCVATMRTEVNSSLVLVIASCSA